MTLVEVLVASAIFTIIVLAVLFMYDRSNRVFKGSVESAEMQQNTRAAFDRLVGDVRMAGFDFDRDGVPTRAAAGPWQPSTMYAVGAVVAPTVGNGFSYRAVTGGITGTLEPNPWPTTAGSTFTGDGSVTWVTLGPVFQQPDEQIEYAGRSAITFRANLNYSSAAANDHGRETAYEPAGGQFPIVTTSNDEIVTYALRSVNGPNNDTLSFWADVSRPRSVYPGGSAETRVDIPNVDLCTAGCNNPPYTLMRFTLDDSGNPRPGVPIANNVRSLNFFYFTDIGGTTLLTKDDGTAITQGAIGGAGQYDPANVGGTTNWADRNQRSIIQTVRLELVGMNEQPDPSYNNSAETLSNFRNYRTYTLRTNVTPRNLGLSGMAEPDIAAPGPPTVTSVCVGSCNVTRVSWNPPVVGNVDTYEVRYDTTSTGTFNSVGVVVPGDVISAPVFNLAPGTLYYFKVVAVNENGRAISSNSLSRSPVNSTRPQTVSTLVASDGTSAQESAIALSWTAPVNNDPNLANISCSGTPISGTTIDPAEPIRYRVWRGTDINFDPSVAGASQVVLDQNVTNQPTGAGGTVINWVDDINNTPSRPPANCKSYYYRMQVYDTCALSSNPAQNNPNNPSTGTSTVFPPMSDPAIHGYASSTVAPTAPGQPVIDYTNGNSTCSRPANTCDVKIVWPAVTTDTSNPTQTITVDQYRIRRERKKASDATWTFDTTLPIVDNASSDPSIAVGTNVVVHDTTALDHDPNDRRKWYYRYTIQALQCGATSADSPTVQFPASCGLAFSTVIESGARSGDGSLANPWVMAANDGIEVIPPGGIGLDRVVFEVYPEPDPTPGGNPLDRRNVNNAPFGYTWQNQSDGQVYRVVITMTNNQGCTEQTDRFIQDDPINCPSATVSQVGASSGSGVAALPWVMNSGDTVTVNQPAGATISTVTFRLIDTTTGTTVGLPVVDNASPFVYTWSDRVDNRDYRLAMSIVYADGCTEDIDRFIKDEPPPVCTGATVSATGAASGDGLTQGTAWVVNGGDILTVNPPSGGLINQVVFTVTPVSPAGAAFAPVSDSTAPFAFTWNDQTDNTIYKVDAVITYSSGCTETVTRYVKDQVCSGATASQTGSVGAGTGLTTASPWVFDAGDTITVAPPVGQTIQNVVFNVYDQPGTTVLATSTDNSSPYTMTWTNRTDNSLYRVEMIVTYTPGCSETVVRYVSDQGLCVITASAPVITGSTQGNTRYGTITFQITNPLPEALTINGIAVGWTRDAGHPVAVLDQITYNGGASPQTVAAANGAPPTTGTLTVSGQPTVSANSSSYTVAIRFNVGNKNSVSDLATQWINSLCIRYTAPSFGGTSASCNVLGSTSGNPSSCN